MRYLEIVESELMNLITLVLYGFVVSSNVGVLFATTSETRHSRCWNSLLSKQRRLVQCRAVAQLSCRRNERDFNQPEAQHGEIREIHIMDLNRFRGGFQGLLGL